MYSKGILALVLALVFFVPGAYGISVIMSGEESGNSFYDAATFNALDYQSLIVHSAVNGATLLQDASGNGDLHKIFGASNHLGEKAQITADVVNAGSWEYTQPVIAADATTASVTGFTLTATDANSIKCNTGATDRLGDKASAAVEVIQGSLNNYHGDAYASSTGVNPIQSFDSASGLQVIAKETASNPTGSTVTNTNVLNGEIFGYNNDGFTHAEPQLIETVGYFHLAAGKTIGSESLATKTCGSRSNIRMTVVGTESQKGQVFEHISATGEGLGIETGATQQTIEADGNTIGLMASSSNAERDISSLKTDIKGTGNQQPSINQYLDRTESFQDRVSAYSNFGGSAGNEIHVSSSASNKENDRANANLNAIGNGQITNYDGSSSAALKTASANNNILDAGILAGKKIEYDVSVSDARRNSATMSNEVLDGSIFGQVSNSADILPHGLKVAQSGSGISGSLMQLKYSGKSATMGGSLQDALEYLNPSNFNYYRSVFVYR